jgi:hypothetical protein
MDVVVRRRDHKLVEPEAWFALGGVVSPWRELPFVLVNAEAHDGDDVAFVQRMLADRLDSVAEYIVERAPCQTRS